MNIKVTAYIKAWLWLNTGNKDRHEMLDGFKFQSLWCYIPLRGEKNDVSNFSLSPLMRYLSNLQVTRTGIKARRISNLGRCPSLSCPPGQLAPQGANQPRLACPQGASCPGISYPPPWLSSPPVQAGLSWPLPIQRKFCCVMFTIICNTSIITCSSCYKFVNLRWLLQIFSWVSYWQGVGGKLSRAVYLAPRPEFQREWIISNFYYISYFRNI